jgi:hypothetical protein
MVCEVMVSTMKKQKSGIVGKNRKGKIKKTITVAGEESWNFS